MLLWLRAYPTFNSTRLDRGRAYTHTRRPYAVNPLEPPRGHVAPGAFHILTLLIFSRNLVPRFPLRGPVEAWQGKRNVRRGTGGSLGGTVPVETIRVLARELYEALTKERSLDAETGFELGRLSAQLGLMVSTAAPIAHEPRHHVPRPPIEAPIPNEAGADGKPQRKRVRPEKRPMRQAQRLLTAPDGRTVVFDFEELAVMEIPKGRKTPVVVEKLHDRKSVWKRLKEQKKMFRKLGAEVESAKF